MFKKEFKYYKSKTVPANLNNVLNFNDICCNHTLVRPVTFLAPYNESAYGLNPVSDWLGYEVLANPGLIYIRNPFTCRGQQYWINQCIYEYTMPPNKSNLDALHVITNNSNWWQMSQTDQKLVEKLRWVTLGYHHNWDTKVYDDSKNDFPKDLAELSSIVAGSLGYNDFKPEAAIVNFYHMDSTLSGHTDHSEKNLDIPLLSFSFGQSAIFLIGGTTLDAKPTALLLHSGDIVVMSKQSRLCYHAVPKILKSLDEPWMSLSDDNGFSEFCSTYIKKSRININVRQVF